MADKIDVLNRSLPVNEDTLKQMDSASALKRLQQGNDHFVKLRKNNNKSTKRDIKPTKRDINAFVKNGADGQHPFAIVLSCVDSRIPTEIIFDQHIGDIFNARIAGNFVNKDVLGSMEFACGRYIYQTNPNKLKEKNTNKKKKQETQKWEGAKLIVVLGHTSCGAIKAACDAVHSSDEAKANNEEIVVPAHLARLVGKLVPIAKATPYNKTTYIDDTARNNVRRTVGDILRRSELLRGMVQSGTIQVKGAMYNVKTGEVDWI